MKGVKNMNKQLKMNKPLIDGLPIYGNFFSLLNYDDERVKSWLFSNFIQLRYLVNDNVVFFERYRSILDNCPFFLHYSLSREIINSIWKDNLIECFIQMLLSDYYIFLYADRYYIPESKQYQTVSFVHELFIYGYDDKEKKFYCKDNIRDGKYTSFECDFYQVEDAYVNIPLNPYFTDVHFLKKENPNINIKFNMNYTLKLIKEYAYSLNSHNCFEVFTLVEYGFKVHKIIMEDLINTQAQKNDDIDIRPFHLFYEHKIMMIKRMDYMKQLYRTNILDEVIKDYQDLADNYMVLRNIILKYNKSFDKKLYQRIIERFQELIQFEEDRLDKLVDLFTSLSEIDYTI